MSPGEISNCLFVDADFIIPDLPEFKLDDYLDN